MSDNVWASGPVRVEGCNHDAELAALRKLCRELIRELKVYCDSQDHDEQLALLDEAEKRNASI